SDGDFDRVSLTEHDFRTTTLAEGDLLFARRSYVLEGSGKCSIVGRLSEPTTFESSVIRARPDRRRVVPRFLYYYFKSPHGRARMASIATRTAVSGIRGTDLAKLTVPCPDPKVPERVAAVLAAYDKLVENNLRRIEILEEMAQAVYREWFVNFRFPGHEDVAMVDSPLGPIPEGWKAVTVSNAVDLNPRIRLARDQEVRFVPMGSLVEGSMVIEGHETRIAPSGSQFQNGDTLLARITPSLENGKTGFVQFLRENEVACGSTEFIVMRSRTLTPE